LPDLLLFNFLLRSENFKGSLNKEIEVLRVFLFGLFIWPNWELRNSSQRAIFCTHVVPEELRVEARHQGAINEGGEAMRAQATRIKDKGLTNL
jgi:hypothetical protein